GRRADRNDSFIQSTLASNTAPFRAQQSLTALNSTALSRAGFRAPVRETRREWPLASGCSLSTGRDAMQAWILPLPNRPNDLTGVVNGCRLWVDRPNFED